MNISPHIKKRPNKEGKYPIYIKIQHKGERRYLATPLAVAPEKYKNGTIKDSKVTGDLLLHQIAPLESKLAKVDNVQLLSIDRVMEILEDKQEVQRVDFIAFADDYIKNYDKHHPNTRTTVNYKALVNSLRDYTGGQLLTQDITLLFLNQFAAYLQTERKVKRPGRGGTMQTMTLRALNSQSLYTMIKEFRTLFNACRLYYNDEDSGRILIPNYPFKRFKFPKVAQSGSEKAISLEELKKIVNYTQGSKNKYRTVERDLFARDMFLLSFYLVGMNPADLYELEETQIRNGQITYRRKKTRSRRSDSAELTISIPPCAQVIFDRYCQKLGERRWKWQNYSTPEGMIRAVASGLKIISGSLGTPHLTWYSARHTWATLARNECGYSIDDIAFALNHSSGRVTDRYIRKDFSLIDSMNARVLELVL